jgi:hypothetical protein
VAAVTLELNWHLMVVTPSETVVQFAELSAQLGVMNNANENASRVRIRLAMTGPPWVSEEFQWKWAHEKLGVLRVMAGLSRPHTANAGTIFADNL